MRAEDIFEDGLLRRLRANCLRKIPINKILCDVEDLPEDESALIFAHLADQLEQHDRLEGAHSVLNQIYFFLCGWNKETPDLWSKTERKLNMESDEEWDEYCRLHEKFEKIRKG
jgi:hypothetical protein